MKSEYQKFVNENIILSSAKEKNSIYYIFTAAKLKSIKDPNALKEDFALNNILEKTEQFCYDIGVESVYKLSEIYKPIQIMLEFDNTQNKKDVLVNKIKDILQLYRNVVLENQENFSSFYRLERMFDDFEESKEMRCFLESLNTRL